MKHMTNLIRRYPLSTILVIVIWVLCLLPWIPETPLSDVSLIDKWTHLVMYGTLTATIWWEGKIFSPQKSSEAKDSTNVGLNEQTSIKTRNAKSWYLLAFLGPVAMGGLVELAQAYCTAGHRSGEWLDFAANSLGVVLGTLIGILLAAFRARR